MGDLDFQTVLSYCNTIAARLSAINGIVGIAIGGSWARNEATPSSDIDIAVYYKSKLRPNLLELQKLAQELDDEHGVNLLSDFNIWGPLWNGGGWIKYNGAIVDWIYRNYNFMSSTVEDCIDGRIVSFYSGGSLQGNHSHICIAQIYTNYILYDPEGLLTQLKQKLTHYPPKLKKVLFDKFYSEAGLSLYSAEKYALRADILLVNNCLIQAINAMVQVLFAHNEQHCLSQKQALEKLDKLPLRINGFSEKVANVLAQPGKTKEQLMASVEQMNKLLVELSQLIDRPMLQYGRNKRGLNLVI